MSEFSTDPIHRSCMMYGTVMLQYDTVGMMYDTVALALPYYYNAALMYLIHVMILPHT